MLYLTLCIIDVNWKHDYSLFKYCNIILGCIVHLKKSNQRPPAADKKNNMVSIPHGTQKFDTYQRQRSY